MSHRSKENECLEHLLYIWTLQRPGDSFSNNSTFTWGISWTSPKIQFGKGVCHL